MDTFIAYTGWIIGLLALVFGIWSYFKMKEAKEPKCYYKTFRNIIKLSEDSDLRITYQGKPVKQVSTTYLFFWNQGKKPIVRTDIQKQIRIYFPTDVTILDYRVINVSRLEIDFTVSNFITKDEAEFVPQLLLEETPVKVANRMDFCFEFLDKNDGAVIEVKHTGDKNTSITIEGSILGVPQGIECKEVKNDRLYRETFNLKNELKLFGNFLVIAFVIPVFVFWVTLFIWNFLNEKNPFQGSYPDPNTLLFGAIALLFVYPLFRIWLISKFYPFRQRLPYPKSLDTHVNIALY